MCQTAWAEVNGFKPTFVDDRKGDVNKGICADDPGLGGERRKGVKKNPSSETSAFGLPEDDDIVIERGVLTTVHHRYHRI